MNKHKKFFGFIIEKMEEEVEIMIDYKVLLFIFFIRVKILQVNINHQSSLNNLRESINL